MGILHPALHDLGEAAGLLCDSVGCFDDGRRAFKDDDLCGAVDVTGTSDEVLHCPVQFGQVGRSRLQGVEDRVHGDIAVMESTEVGGIGVASMLTAPLRTLCSCLRPAVHDSCTQSGEGANGGTEQCGKSCVHGHIVASRA
ncbi:hypothetical protein ACQEU6_33600 [Spirillospora sp. CA-108201]